MKTKMNRLISVLLVLVMVLQMAPLQVLATDTGSTATSTIEESAAVTEVSIPPSEVPADIDAAYAPAYAAGKLFVPDHPEIKREVYELRTATEKHFEMADGTFTAVAYAYPIHYEEDGIWLDYDNTLSQTQSSGRVDMMAVNGMDVAGVQTYQTVNGDMTRSFVTGGNGAELYSVEKSGTGFSFGFLNAADETELAILEAAEELETESALPAAVEEAAMLEAEEDVHTADENAAIVPIAPTRTLTAELIDLEPAASNDLNASMIPDKLGSKLIYEDVLPGVHMARI